MSPAGGRRPNSVRIIGGEWRGRRLRFPAVAGLRPTSDRRRETLFNWLAPRLQGARCLDLFAGSGALGFEAVSRGAARAVLVDAQREVAAALLASRDELAAGERVEVVREPAARFLTRPPERFDLVFVDPPFADPALADEVCGRLEAGWLAPGARVYVERDARGPAAAVPPRWQPWRELESADVRVCVYVAG